MVIEFCGKRVFLLFMPEFVPNQLLWILEHHLTQYLLVRL
jgi:hypothetical protein